MKHYKDHTVTYPIIEKVSCDICGQYVEYKVNDAYDCHVSFKFGEYHRDGGGEGNDITFDFCQHCAMNVVIPSLILKTENSVKWEEWSQ